MEAIHPLKTYRKSQQPPLSQQELADELGVDRVTVARWESGRRQINEKRLSEIAQKTGIPARQLRPDLIGLAKLVGAE